MLYLHEIIDIVGTGQEAYLKTVGERGRHSESEGISRLVGTWKVIGSTNRWPRVVNLWEMESWTHWAEALERQFLPGKVDAALAPWWVKATEWRSGGMDRILEPASYSPTREALQRAGLRSWVCTHTITRLQPGAADHFIAAFATGLKPLLEGRGLTLLGMYRAAMRSDEAVSIWAAPDFQAVCKLYAAWNDVPELAAWERRFASMRLGYETMWLVPSVDCFFHPEHFGSGA